jgi:hypothetical protein
VFSDGVDTASWLHPPERIVDFGGRALHLSTIAGKAITAAFYGAEVKRPYYIGCSQGGHHDLMERSDIRRIMTASLPAIRRPTGRI